MTTSTLRLEKFGKYDFYNICDAEDIKELILNASKFKTEVTGITPDGKLQSRKIRNIPDDIPINIYSDKCRNENLSLYNALKFNKTSDADLGVWIWNDTQVKSSVKYQATLINGLGEASGGAKAPVSIKLVKI